MNTREWNKSNGHFKGDVLDALILGYLQGAKQYRGLNGIGRHATHNGLVAKYSDESQNKTAAAFVRLAEAGYIELEVADYSDPASLVGCIIPQPE